MDGIFALIFIVYILSAVVQALMGKDVRKRQRGAGAPWPGTYPPAKTPEEGAHIPEGFPFPIEDVFTERHEEKSSLDDLEHGDVTLLSTEDGDLPTVGPWEDKSWGSLGKSLEGQSHEEAKHDEFYSHYFADDFADDFDDTALEEDDIAEFMVPTESVAFERAGFTSRFAVIQGIIMSEVLRRPRGFSRCPITRQ